MGYFTFLKANFYVGRNSKKNWELLDNASDDDIIVHLDNYPSCYVIIDSKSIDKISPAHITYAGKLCLKYSQNKIPKNIKGVNYIYTSCKNVIKGKSTGSIKLLVQPDRKFQKVKVYKFSPGMLEY